MESITVSIWELNDVDTIIRLILSFEVLVKIEGAEIARSNYRFFLYNYVSSFEAMR